MRGRPSVTIRAACLAAGLGCLTACAGGGGGLKIGMQQTAIDLQFKVAALAKPVSPKVIIQIIPAPPQVRTPADLTPFESPAPAEPLRSLPPAPVAPTCPTAPPDASPARLVTRDVQEPPHAGGYDVASSGRINVTGGSVPLSLPYPPTSTRTISPPHTVTPAGISGLQAAAPQAEFTVEDRLSPTFVQTDVYRVTPTALSLAKRTIVDGTRTLVFTPDPVVDVFRFGNEGDSWVSSAADLGTNQAMVFQGTIGPRDRIDVCGELIDTYRVTYTSSLVNLDTGERITTVPGDNTTFNIATQYGGLLVKEHVHTTDTRNDPATGAQVVVELDHTSQLTSVDPKRSR